MASQMLFRATAGAAYRFPIGSNRVRLGNSRERCSRLGEVSLRPSRTTSLRTVNVRESTALLIKRVGGKFTLSFDGQLQLLTKSGGKCIVCETRGSDLRDWVLGPFVCEDCAT